VKQIVSELRQVKRGLKIGATRGSKNSPPGYYMITNRAELLATIRPHFHQLISELHTVESLTGEDFNSSAIAERYERFTAPRSEI